MSKPWVVEEEFFLLAPNGAWVTHVQDTSNGVVAEFGGTPLSLTAEQVDNLADILEDCYVVGHTTVRKPK